ncbi:MAG: hypothetical protein ACC628_01585 [Pirellulaceae bacterium]
MWYLDGTTAKLKTESLSASLQLLRPDFGLTELQVGLGTTSLFSIDAAALLQVRRGSGSPVGEQVSESYVRGADLVATYEASETNPVHPQIYWRELSGDRFENVGVELIVSVETSLPDSDPATRVSSVMPADGCLIMRDAGSALFKPLDHKEGSHKYDSSRDAQMLLVRLPGCRLSYVEMVSPTDCFPVRISLEASPSSVVHVDYLFFGERLEKGVIRRSRLRGYFIPRESDTATAAQLYHDFAASEPPLTV